MKKNIDNKTAALFEAVKYEYIRNFSTLLESDICANVTVKQVMALVSDKKIDGVRLADEAGKRLYGNKVASHDGILGSCVRLAEGYTASVAALPRLYERLGVLVGEPRETIPVGPRPSEHKQEEAQSTTDAGRTFGPFGLTEEAAKDRKNKKQLAILKKFCKKSCAFVFGRYVFHDAQRRVAVWSDAHIMLLSRALFNPAAAGLMVDKEGMPYGMPVVMDNRNSQDNRYFYYPDYIAAIPAHGPCYSFAAADAVETAKRAYNAAPKGTRQFTAARLDGVRVNFNAEFVRTAFAAVDGDVFMQRPKSVAVGLLDKNNPAAGLVLVLPDTTIEVLQGEENEAEVDIIALDLDYATELRGFIPDAVPTTLPDVRPMTDATGLATTHTDAKQLPDIFAAFFECERNTSAFANIMGEEYERLYLLDEMPGGVDYQEDVMLFDSTLRLHNAAFDAFTVELANVRKDFISSDREAAAFVAAVRRIMDSNRQTAADAVVLDMAGRVRACIDSMETDMAAQSGTSPADDAPGLFEDAINAYCAALNSDMTDNSTPAPRHAHKRPQLRPRGFGWLRNVRALAASFALAIICTLLYGSASGAFDGTHANVEQAAPVVEESTTDGARLAVVPGLARQANETPVTGTAANYTPTAARNAPGLATTHTDTETRRNGAKNRLEQAAPDMAGLVDCAIVTAAPSEGVQTTKGAGGIAGASCAPLSQKTADNSHALDVCGGTAWSVTLFAWC